MATMLGFAGARRRKWIVLFGWLVAMVVAAGAAQLPAKFTEAEDNESTSYLPGDAESTAALKAAEELQDGEQAPIVVVYRREGGLTDADRARLATDVRRFNSERERLAAHPDADVARPFKATSPLSDRPIVSPDGAAALVTGSIVGDGEGDTLIEPVDKLREIASNPGGGLEVKVSGPAGFAADAIKVFESINGTLLLAAVGIVFVLLILIYRSPIFFWIPLFAVVVAEIATRSIGYLLTELGVTVNTQSSSILSVLVLGAGTDYALLLVARYKEELRRHEDKHEAIALALRTAGPAIVASGLTVIAALLCLTFAKVNGTAGLGPIGALGIAVAVVTMLTLLPAMLAIFGRRAFWHPPIFGTGNGIPHFGDQAADETHGTWRRIGELVSAGPRRVWIGTVAVLAVMCLGLLNHDDGLTTGNSYVEKVEAVEGQELIAKSFPAGANAPTDVIVPNPSKVDAVSAAVDAAPGVAEVREVTRGETGVLLNAVLEPDPYSTEAFDLVPGIRAAAKRAGGRETLVGGASAVEFDVREAAAHDTRVIVPLAIVVVCLILIAVLRAVVLPLLLIATVVVSFAAALGVALVVYDVIFGFPGIDPSLPLFAFVFLVALGIDYNIFLMARVREETGRWGTRHGMVRGLAVTGAVITSAGVVLAGTFSVLAILPLVFLTEIGFVIAFGVLLDTLIVRSLLVPALVLDIGPRAWWPSKLAQASEHDDLPPDPFGPREAERQPDLV